ncbi:MAG: hypothetical protein ACOYOP_00620 [Microthrixaceae bacterium]
MADDEGTDRADPADVGEWEEVVGPDDDEVTYDCTTWAGESRAMLAALLDSRGIDHVWQGTEVSVHEDDEEAVDALIEDVLASARPALDPTADKVVFEVGTWPAALQTSLADALTVAELPYEWDEQGDLVVYAEHEEEVEAIVEQLPDPDDAELSADDGLAVHELLDRLFVAADRLVRRPDDAAGVVGLVNATGELERTSLPFGFEPPQWRRLVGAAVRVRDALEATDPEDPAALDDAALAEAADDVRALLRQYV